MEFIADLHIHSRYSRATSRSLTPEALSLWGQKKGIRVIGTGDFTHPEWFNELKEKFQEAENGLFRLKPEYEKENSGDVPSACASKSLFILSGEISCIYKKNDRTRKNHNLILMPDFESAEKFNTALDKIGNIKSDGRPILGLDSKILLEMMLEASDRGFFIPAHVWTPWFSLFGSKSGFDDIEECFEDLTHYIHALETGLSSDPPMNRLLSALDKYLLVSNSDAHSPSKLGREANIFNCNPDYDSMIRAMKEKNGFEGTIEFYPEEGKYHMDGHRKCNMMLHPNDTIKNDGICPVCGKPVTVGVFHRVAELADRESPVLQKEFHSLIPLAEILSEIIGTGPNTKTVNTAYEKLLAELGPELDILLHMDLSDIETAGGILLSRAISRMRSGEVIRQEGYDGEYGVIRLFNDSEKHELIGQKRLFKVVELEKEKKPKPDVKKIVKAKKKDLKTGKQASFVDPVLDPLNEKQREAVLHTGTHLIINAGPGTGKTLTLTHKIVSEIQNNGLKPDQVLALTFTNKAAREMMERVNALLPGVTKEGITISTFHGFCLNILREDGNNLNIPHDFSICSEGDSRLIIDNISNEAGADRQTVSRFKKALSDLKYMAAMGREPDEEYEELLPLFEKYMQGLRSLNMLDFDDLEAETLRLFIKCPDISLEYAEKFKRVFVDEYQDTNHIQSLILKHLIKDKINLICAIGDPDQAIYGFRGADMDNFYRFAEDFNGAFEISLSINYRSTDNILESAAAILGKESRLEGTSGKGDFVRISECGTAASEAEMVVEQIEKILGGTSYFSLDSGRVASHEDGDDNTGFGDIGVLFRTNSQGDALEEALSRAGIPYVRSGEKPLTGQYPVDVIMRYLQSQVFTENKLYMDKYLELMQKYKIETDALSNAMPAGKDIIRVLDDIISMHNFDLSSDESMRAVTRLKETVKENPGITSITDILSLERGIDNTALKGDRAALMSVHAAKGLEWPVVFITGCEDRIIPLKIFGDSDDEEERRLFYVGITRAKNRLILSHTKSRKINNRSLDMNVSPYLDLIPEKNIKPLERTRWKPKKQEKQLSLF